MIYSMDVFTKSNNLTFVNVLFILHSVKFVAQILNSINEIFFKNKNLSIRFKLRNEIILNLKVSFGLRNFLPLEYF